ncbi:MAG: hypothetical protein ACMZ66_11925 [Thalassospira sp.]|uniref:hypothetical protein n=1 Tax=Thalassospira sp. TaxID=1912094 RepID=UPI003A87128D
MVLKAWGSEAGVKKQDTAGTSKEALTLALDSSLAVKTLGWEPRLDLTTCVSWIVDWHKDQLDGKNMRDVTDAQITSFEVMMDK